MSLWHTLTYPFRRQTGRPLSARQPVVDRSDSVPLGMEAIDLNAVNTAARQNDALERTNAISVNGQRGPTSFAQAAATYIKPMPDNETYAAAYHRAFQKKDPKT